MPDEADLIQAIQVTAARVVAICTDLVEADARPACSIERKSVPKDRGVYFWRWLKTGDPVYVGSAVGQWGIYQRVVQEHLQPGYWKKRKGEEQSVFRKAVAADARVSPGAECVDFIEQHFSLAFLPCPGDTREVVKAAEALLIAALEPKYNDWEAKRLAANAAR